MGERKPDQVVLMKNFPSTRMFSHSDSDSNRPFFLAIIQGLGKRARGTIPCLLIIYPLHHIESVITLPHSYGTSSKAERIRN